MGTFFHKDLAGNKPDHRLAVCWISGLCVGALLSPGLDGIVFSHFSEIACSTASFTGLLFAVCLPLIIPYLISSISGSGVILVFVTFKGIALGILGAALSIDRDFWLARFFLLFSQILIMPLCWMWWQFLLNRGQNRSTVFFLFSALAFLIASLDYTIVSPFCLRMIFWEG